MENNKLIIVTGFGPFAGHELVNASWEAVRILPDEIRHNEIIYKISKVFIPVVYEEVDNAIENIWQQNPDLVVHCGVHGGAKSIHLEKFAYNKFCRPDYSGKKLQCSTVRLENNGSRCRQLQTELDVERIAKTLNLLGNEQNEKQSCLFICSKDVGNYLCGYIYLKSLDKNCSKSLFIHVPPVDEPLSSEETSRAVYKVIEECVKEIHENFM